MKIPEFDFDSPPRPIGYAHDTRGRATPGLKDMLAPVLTRHLAPFTPERDGNPPANRS